MTAHDGARADARKRHEAEEATHAPAGIVAGVETGNSPTATPVGPQIANLDVEAIRTEHSGRGMDGEIGYVRDDLSYVQRCCFECDEPVPCRTTLLLAELDRLTAALARVQELADEWAEDRKTYPIATDDRAAFSEMAVRLCERELRAALTTTTATPTTESKEDDHA